MFKALLKLGLLAVLPLAYLMVSPNYNPFHSLRDWFEEKYMNTIYLGTLKEIEIQILGEDNEIDVSKFDEIASRFSNEIKLAKIEDVVGRWRVKSRLLDGELVSLGTDDALVAYRLSGTDWAITVMGDESAKQEVARMARGPLFLFQEVLAEIPNEQLESSIEALQARFGWRIEYLNSQQLGALKDGKNTYHFDDIQWIAETSEDDPIFVFPISKNASLSVLPFKSLSFDLIVIAAPLTLFLITMCFSLLLWLWPLWKDHRKLNKTARDFGNGHLASRVSIRKGSFSAELSESFNRMADNVQNLISTNQNLTNAVAHDLRTPLARLRFASEILSSGECSPDEVERYQNTIGSSIDALDYLISQTLTHSRYNRSTDISHFNKSNFAEIILEETEQFSFQDDEIRFETNIDSQLLNAEQFVDSKALRRALCNLLSNASKHAKSYVLVSFFRLENKIGFKVEDDGPGIAEIDYESIFQPYTQLGNCERSHTQGIGLGLAIVKQITQWHKGKIKVEKSPLGGASFSLIWEPQLLI